MKKIYTKYSPKGHYTPGIISNGTLYISGQTSVNPETGKVPTGGIKEETAVALKKIEYVLEAAGLKKENVVMCRIYMTSSDFWSEVNEAYIEFFGEHKPARIAVPVRELNHGCLVEIEAIAEVE